MNFFLRALIIILVFFANSCSKEKPKVSLIKEKEINLQMIDAYREGVEAFEKGDSLLAAKNLMKQKYCFHSLNGRQDLF